VDTFGTDEVTFVNILKCNLFLGILISHKPFLLDRCPVSGSLVGITRWLPVDGFEALQQCSPGKKKYLSLVHELLKIFDLASWCFGTVPRNLTSYQMMMLRWGISQVPAKRAEQAFPLSNLGAQISHWAFIAPPPPRSFVFYPDYGPPWVDTSGGLDRLLSSPRQSCNVSLNKAILSLSPPFLFLG
jgi:hypothetical protein